MISEQDYREEIHQVLCKALEEISIEKQYHDKCMSMETLAFTLVACHLELVPETWASFQQIRKVTLSNSSAWVTYLIFFLVSWKC